MKRISRLLAAFLVIAAFGLLATIANISIALGAAGGNLNADSNFQWDVDTLTFQARNINTILNQTFTKESNHTLSVSTSTTSNTAGGNLTVAAGTASGNATGGTLALNAGGTSSGSNGAITIGASTTNSVAVTPNTTFAGNTTFGDASTDTITLTGTAASDLNFVKEVNRTISVRASTTADTAGANLTVAAADGVGTGNGGDLTLNAGNAGTGTDGSVKIGAANTSACTITPNTTASGTLTVTGAATFNSDLSMGAGDMVNHETGTATSSSGAATANTQACVITSESLTTAAGSDFTLTLTNNQISTASCVQVTVGRGTSTQGIPHVLKVTPSSGSVAIVIRNIHASEAFNGTVLFNVFVAN